MVVTPENEFAFTIINYHARLTWALEISNLVIAASERNKTATLPRTYLTGIRRVRGRGVCVCGGGGGGGGGGGA